MSRLTAQEQTNVDAGLTTDGREIVECLHDHDEYVYWEYEDGLSVELPEFLDMVMDIWDSDWFWDSFENVPEMKVYVLKDQATAWYLTKKSVKWHEEAGRDMAHEFFTYAIERFGWE